MDRKKEIIDTINKISGRYSAYEVFSDWIRCYALSISNYCQFLHGRVWQEREQEYLNTIKKYSRDEQKMFIKMNADLIETMESEMTDVLGWIYMESGMGSRSAGQFFTPYHLSRLCAKVSTLEADENGIYRLCEPSCGGGGMIIAAAEALNAQGIDYQRKMRVVAQDLDWKGVYMCYLQLSLYGIRAVVAQGDTLAEPYGAGQFPKERVLYTPAEMGVLL